MTVYYELTNELAQFYNSKFVSISDYPNRILDRCSINSWIEVGGDVYKHSAEFGMVPVNMSEFCWIKLSAIPIICMF